MYCYPAGLTVADLMKRDARGFIHTWKDCFTIAMTTGNAMDYDGVLEFVHGVQKEKGDSHCLPRALARHFFGTPDLYQYVRLLMAIAVRDSPQQENVIALDIGPQVSNQRGSGLEPYLTGCLGKEFRATLHHLQETRELSFTQILLS